jgi:hypothetical protein
MPLRNCLTLLRAKLPWFRITRVTFYILLVILSTKLGEFILESLILVLIMLLCIRMRHLVLELALSSRLIQRGSESNVNKVSIRDGQSSVNLACQGHCAGVFIGI